MAIRYISGGNMKKVQKINFTVQLKNGQLMPLMADNKEHFILSVAALRKHYGARNVKVVRESIKLSKVIRLENKGRVTIIDKAGA
jgi:hypothetical protein